MDNETKIAQDLANKLPQTPPMLGGYPEVTPEVQPQFVDKMLPEEHLTQLQLLDYLQVPSQERHNPIVEDYIRTVYQWARDNAGEGDINQLMRVISEQEMHMGSKLKPDRLRRLAEYVKISKIRQGLAARERALYYE
jgi:hypothetical protein